MSSPFRTPKPPTRSRRETRSANKTQQMSRGLKEEDKTRVDSPGALQSSPGGSLNILECTPNRNVTPGQSPFREWATSSLDCLDQEMMTPASVERSMLSPSYSQIRPVKIDTSPLQEHDSRSNDVLSMSKNASPITHVDQTSAFEMKIGSELDKTASNTLVKIPIKLAEDLAFMQTRRPRLSICELFSFDMNKDVVNARGFDTPAITYKYKSVTVPATPSLQTLDYKERNADQSDSRKKVCSCKKSRCLKLYCECFAAGEICSGCKCVDCANDGDHEDMRLQAVDTIKQRNNNAFAPKIVDEVQQDKGMHARGCRCKKSHCLKKYCECYQAGVQCTDKCKCEECQNRKDFDSTPRDHKEIAFRVAPMSSSRSASPDSKYGDNDNLLSPPRNKKPRVLDFNLLSTPSHTTDSNFLMNQASPIEGYDDGDSKGRSDNFGALMFGSPSAGFLNMT